MMVAALYVERAGVYWDLPDVDPWDRERDARTYAGPHPVVAHPPCERWGRYFSRYIGTKVDDDGETFITVGCRDCKQTISFPARAKLAVTHNRALDLIAAAGPEGMQSADIKQRLGVSDSHVGRILQRLKDNGAIVRLSRGWYAVPPPALSPAARAALTTESA